jgi:hypothetical protein
MEMKPLRILVYACVALILVALSVNLLVTNPPPPDYSLDNMPRIGMDADYNFAPSVLNAASTVGAKILRSHMSWTTLEAQRTDPSHYNWATYDSIFSRIAAANLSPILVIDKCPTWACPYMRGPINAANMQDYSDMVNAVVARYSRPPYNVHMWELFDEPDGTAGPDGQWNYGNHPAEYVQALSILYNAVKSVNPEAIVLNGGVAYDYPTTFRPEFVYEMLAAGGAQYTDALNFHYFRINGPGWSTIGQKADELRGIMGRAGVDLPLVCTSVGESSENIDPWYSSESQQAHYLVKVYAQSASAGIRSTTWYLTQDFDCPPGACPSGWEVWARHGIIRQDGATKLAYQAMQTFAQEIGSGAYQRQLGSESGVTGSLEGYYFGGSAEGRPQVSVIWNNTSAATTLIIPAGQSPNLLRAVSMTGQTLNVTSASDGTARLSVDSNPVYLEWRSLRFVDVPADHTFYSYIENLAQMRAVSGFEDSTFRPNNLMLRGQLCKMMMLSQSWPVDTTGGPHFSDIPPLSPLYPYIETAYNRQVINGFTDGTFRPYSTVTRGQMCKIIANSRGWQLISPDTPAFSDVPTTYIFYSYVETCYSRGIISGFGDGTFRPNDNATRGQVSKIVYNAVISP